jgi:hypothetical protein
MVAHAPCETERMRVARDLAVFEEEVSHAKSGLPPMLVSQVVCEP